MDVIDILNTTCDSSLEFCDETLEQILDLCGDKTRKIAGPYKEGINVLYDGSMKLLIGKTEIFIGSCMLGKAFATQMMDLGKKVIAKLDDTDIKVYK